MYLLSIYSIYYFFLLILLKIKTKYIRKIATIIFFGISVLRYKVGVDWLNYEQIYQGLMEKKLEPFFYLLMNFFKRIGLNYLEFQMVISFISILFLYKAIKKNSVNPIASFLIYYSFFYLTYNMGVMRQGLAMILGLLGILNLYTNKKKTLMYYVLAVGIHYSSIVLFPTLIFSKKRNNYAYILFIVLGVLLLVNLPLEFNKNNIYIYKLNEYLKHIGQSHTLTQFIYLLINAILVFFYIIKGNNKLYKEISVLYLGLAIVLWSYPGISRVTSYFQIIIILSLAEILKSVRISKISKIFIILLVSMRIVKFILIPNLVDGEIYQSKYIPYKSIFNKEKMDENK